MTKVPFLLDEEPNTYRNRKTLQFRQRGLRSAKRFRIGEDVILRLLELARDQPELYKSQRAFAIPPFPDTYVEFDLSGAVFKNYEVFSPVKTLGVLRLGDRAMIYARNRINPGAGQPKAVGPVDVYADITPDGIDVGCYIDVHKDALASLMKNTAGLIGLTELLWLLMHQPRSPIIKRDISAGSVIGAKAPRFWKAHSILTINLSNRNVPLLIHKQGRTGGVREHEVRGTWVHYRLDRRCIHSWERVERPDGAPERWACAHCNAMRVWRRDHVRGDGKLGTKFHDYEVKL